MENIRKSGMYFEIRSYDDRGGIGGTYESSEKALETINQACAGAKKVGYDPSKARWLIVCVVIVKEYESNGNFVREERSRFVAERVTYSASESAFVFAN